MFQYLSLLVWRPNVAIYGNVLAIFNKLLDIAQKLVIMLVDARAFLYAHFAAVGRNTDKASQGDREAIVGPRPRRVGSSALKLCPATLPEL